MATPQVSDSYASYASKFFHDLDLSPPQKPASQATPKPNPGVSFDDVISIMQNSRTGDDAIHRIGTMGQGYVINGFQEELRKEINAATAKPMPNASTTAGAVADEGGFFSNVFKWMGESKAGKLLGFGTEVADTTSTVPKIPAAGGTGGVMAGTVSKATDVVSNVIGGVYGAIDLITNFGSLSPAHGALSGLTVGASIGSFIPGVGTAIGGLVGAAVGGLLSLFKKSGKDKDQKMRDQMRSALQQAQIIDEKFTIGLADGSRYDIGIDGGKKQEFGGLHPFDVDMKNPLAVKIATFLAPLTLVVCGGNKKLSSDLAGYLTNASLSNAGTDESKARANVQAIYGQFKLKPESLLLGLGQLASAGAIGTDVAKAYVGILKDLFPEKSN